MKNELNLSPVSLAYVAYAARRAFFLGDFETGYNIGAESGYCDTEITCERFLSPRGVPPLLMSHADSVFIEGIEQGLMDV